MNALLPRAAPHPAAGEPDRSDTIDLLPIAVVRVDGASVALNRAAERLTGWRRDEITRIEHWFAAIAGTRHDEARRLYELDAQLGSPRPRLMPLRRRDGAERLVEQTVYGEGAARLWFLNDVTDQLQAEAALRAGEEAAKQAIERLPAVAFQLRVEADGTRRLVFISERINELHGWPASALCADPRRVMDAVALEDRRRVTSRLEVALRRHLPLKCDYRVAIGSSTRWLRLTARPQSQTDGAVVWAGLVSDVDDLRRGASEARVANRAKSEFLSRMSHELRTPLNAILGFTQLLEKLEPNERQRRYLGYIEQAGEHLLKLINEVLELSRIEAGAMKVEIGPVDPAAIFAEVVTLMAPAAAKNGISLIAPTTPMPVLRADRIRLKQVLLNFVSNAIKYNRQNGRVTLAITTSSPGVCRIAVTDTGPGIPPDQQKGMFVAFNRLGAETSGVEGTGIGLVITKRLVDLMHGAIGFDSSPDGTTFWIELPIVSEARHSAPGGDRRRAPRKQTRKLATVLYIEHNADEVRLLREMLQEAPHIALITAPHVDVAGDLATGRRLDLVIANGDPPHPNALELRRRLSGREATAGLPLFVLASDPETLAELPPGVEGFVKPVRIAALLGRLEALVAASQPPGKP